MKNFIIGIILVIGVCALLYFKDDIFNNNNKFIKLGYSEISSGIIKKLNLENDINDTYYKTLDVALTSDDFIKENINNYMKINYKNNKYFIKSINTLLEENYTAEDINDISYIFDSKDFKDDYLLRYANYIKANSSLDTSKIVIYVNIGLDNDFYTNIKEIENPDSLLVLVNKYNKLPDNYSPKDLETFDDSYTSSSTKRQMRKVAYDALIKMINDIRKEGMDLWLNSGFRTKSYQNMLFTNSVTKNGMEHALKYSAKQRHSEHETGLAADISSVKGMLDGFEKYKEYDWLKENAYKYGFIERYPEGKENITGYAYEPWHYRYVGVDVATIIKNENITFEEYAVKYLNY